MGSYSDGKSAVSVWSAIKYFENPDLQESTAKNHTKVLAKK